MNRSRSVLCPISFLTLLGTAIPAPVAAQDLLDAATAAAGPERLVVAGPARGFWVTSQGRSPLSNGTFALQFAGDDRAHIHIHLPGSGSYEHGSDGKQVWEIDTVAGPAFRRGVGAAASHRLFALLRGDFKAARASYDTAEATEPGLFALRTKGAAKPDLWTVDAETKHVTAVKLQTRSALDEPSVWELKFDDWTDKSGRAFPGRITWRYRHIEVVLQCERVDAKAPTDTKKFSLSKQHAATAATFERTRTGAPERIQCRIVELEPQPTATMRSVVKMQDFAKELGRMLPAIMRHVLTQGGSPAGAPYTRYHAVTDGKSADVEAGVPVVRPVKGNKLVQAGTLPGGRAVTTWHVGPYHTLKQSHDRLQTWVKAQKLETLGAFWEIYWTDPGLEPDPAKWRTQLVQPIK